MRVDRADFELRVPHHEAKQIIEQEQARSLEGLHSDAVYSSDLSSHYAEGCQQVGRSAAVLTMCLYDL